MKIYLSHFPFEPPGAAAFYESLGRNVVLWGRFEYTIDSTLRNILDHPDCTIKIPNQGMPVSFKRKIEFWKRLHKHEGFLSERRDRALQFAANAAILRKKRDTAIHSMIGHFEYGTDAGAQAEIRTPASSSTIWEFWILKTGLDDLQTETKELLDELNAISVSIVALIWCTLDERGMLPTKPEATP